MAEAILMGNGGGSSEGYVLVKIHTGLTEPTEAKEGDIWIQSDLPFEKITVGGATPTDPNDYDAVIRYASPRILSSTKDLLGSISVDAPEIITDMASFIGTDVGTLQNHIRFYENTLQALYIKGGGVKYYNPEDSNWHILSAFAFQNGTWVQFSFGDYNIELVRVPSSGASTYGLFDSNFTDLGYSTVAIANKYFPITGTYPTVTVNGKDMSISHYDYKNTLLYTETYTLGYAPFSSSTTTFRGSDTITASYQGRFGTIRSYESDEYNSIASKVAVFDFENNCQLMLSVNSGYNTGPMTVNLFSSGDRLFALGAGNLGSYRNKDGTNFSFPNVINELEPNTFNVISSTSMPTVINNISQIVAFDSYGNYFSVITNNQGTTINKFVYTPSTTPPIPIETIVLPITSVFTTVPVDDGILMYSFIGTSPAVYKVIKVPYSSISSYTEVVLSKVHPSSTNSSPMNFMPAPDGSYIIYHGAYLKRIGSNGIEIASVMIPYTPANKNSRLHYPTYIENNTKW